MYGLGCCEECSGGNLAGLGLNLPIQNSPSDTSANRWAMAETVAQLDPTGFSEMALTVTHAFSNAYDTVEQMLGIGQGRRDADAIVPLQNAIGDRLTAINASINQTYSIPQLQAWISEVQQMGVQYQRFVNQPSLVADGDRRASDQGLDTIMPLIDGTDHTGTIVRPDRGTIGTLARRIQALGGSPSLPPMLTEGAGMYPVLEYSIPGYGALPQAGWLPPVAVPPSIGSQQILSAGFGGSALLPVLAIGALLLLRR